MTPDVTSPFGAYADTGGRRHLLRFAQNAPRNPVGKQLARWARDLYLWRAPLPVDVQVGDLCLRCYLKDNTSERKFVFTPWRFDAQERAMLAAVLPPDGVFVDIGANVGIYTLSAALLLGSTGRIVAIEPYPPANDRLRFNIAATRAGRGQWPRVDVLDIGVAARECQIPLRIDAGNLGGGSIAGGDARFSTAGTSKQLVIRCRPLRDILAELGVTRIDALKIDIEGAEDQALKPFLESADVELLPRRMIIENSDSLWTSDLRGALMARGFRPGLRTRLNTVWSLETTGRERRQ